MVVALTIEKMIQFYHGNIHDVSHFLKVYAFAKTIGELEGLTPQTQETLELAAVVHDIACPLCREKYGNTNGKKQELESPPLIENFLPLSQQVLFIIQKSVPEVFPSPYTGTLYQMPLLPFHLPDTLPVLHIHLLCHPDNPKSVLYIKRMKHCPHLPDHGNEYQIHLPV